jgi:hypothetical protein
VAQVQQVEVQQELAEQGRIHFSVDQLVRHLWLQMAVAVEPAVAKR